MTTSSCATYLSSTETSQAVRRGHEDQTKGRATDHEEEALSSAPEIQQLSHWNVYRRRDGIGNNVDDGEQRVGSKVAGNVGNQASDSSQSEAVGQEDEPDAIATLKYRMYVFAE